MRTRTPEPKGKLDAKTGYSFTTPVWDGSAWVRPAIMTGTGKTAPIANGPEDQPRTAPVQWEKIDWRKLSEKTQGVAWRRSRCRGTVETQSQSVRTHRHLSADAVRACRS